MFKETKLSNEVAQLISSARLSLMMNRKTTFFSVVLSNLKQVPTLDHPTAATDGLHLWLNPEFVEKQTMAKLVGLLFHEVGHIILNHLDRRKWLEIPKETWPQWGEACEHAVNNLVVGSGFQIPDGGVYDPKYKGWSTVQIYEHLLQNPEEQDEDFVMDIFIPGANCEAGDSSADSGENDPLSGDAADAETKAEQHQQDVTDLLLRSAQQAEMTQPGSVPGHVQRLLDDLLNPKLPWYLILENYVEPYARDDYSRRKPNKKYMPEFYLPSLQSDEFQDMFTAVDVSGSMSDEDLSKITTEIRHIHNMLNPTSTRIVTVDTQIHDDLEYAQGEYIDDLVLHGGGGTEIGPVIDMIKEQQPKLALIFTDGYFYMPDLSEVYSDLVWIISNNPEFTADRGEVIHYDG